MKLLLLLALLFSFNAANGRTILIMGQSNARLLYRTNAIDGSTIDCTHVGAIADFAFNLDVRTVFGSCLLAAQAKTIDGIIFWQGESDTYTQYTANAWGAAASDIIEKLQFYFKRAPILMVEIHQSPGCTFCLLSAWETVREIQQNFYGVYKIDSSYYPQNPQYYIHLSAEGYMMIAADINGIFNSILQ